MTLTLIKAVLTIGMAIHSNLMLSQRETTCLAHNIYFEARGESRQGQIAVANVTLNRVAHAAYPDTICGVVYQKSQFSWTHGADQTPKEREAYAAAMAIAVKTMSGEIGDLTGGAMHFYSGKQPAYARKLRIVAKIGNHTFLR